MARTAQSQQTREFAAPEDAHKHAIHYARYSHQTMLVWPQKDGPWVAAPTSIENLERMLHEMDNKEVFAYHGDGTGTILNCKIAKIMPDNYRVGVPC